jgi:general secretion pathway protein N
MFLGVAGAIALCGVIGAGALRAAAPPTGVPEISASSAARPKEATADQRPGNPLWAVPLSSLDATRERPLFSSSRRPLAPSVAAVAVPPPPVPKAPPPAPARPSLVLVGTVSGPAGGMAVFTDTATSTVVRLHTHEGHGGWILRSVSVREATLQKDGETAVLALPRRDSVSAATAGAPARIPLPVLRRP